jgi:hypothetical protein
MTTTTGSRPAPAPPDHRTSAAGIQDALLGGRHHTPGDRSAAQQIAALNPRAVELAHAGRDWVGTLLRDLAPFRIGQVADLGCGMPRPSSTGPANTHEFTPPRDLRPRCAYLDIDPAVVACRDTLPSWAGGAARADLTCLDQVHDAMLACGLDLARPVLAVLGQVLIHLDDDQVTALLGGLADLLAPGSYLALSHPVGAHTIRAAPALAEATGLTVHTRTQTQLTDLLHQVPVAFLLGPHPVGAWPRPAIPTGGADLVCALARTGRRR